MAQRQDSMDDLLSMDLGRLLDVQVSVATRREENAFALPAAITVFTAGDIRRSGHRRLADLLQDAPGLHVGKWDANKWAVSSRNSLSRFSSTLLVLVDGRPAYTPLYGGVRWEAQNIMLADVERIEIIRGSGGPLWGANAVDGIVNVVTQSAGATQGSLAELAVGDGAWRHQVNLRHGAKLDESTAWRLSYRRLANDAGLYLDHSQSTHGGLRAEGASANDDGVSEAVEARLDGRWSADAAWTVQAQRSRSRFNEDRASTNRVTPNLMRYDGGFVMGEWRQEWQGAQWRLRATLDELKSRDDILRDDQRIADLDLQSIWPLGAHTLTAGAGWREYQSTTSQPIRPAGVTCTICFGFWPESGGERTLSLFVQDQWAIRPGLTLTAGAKGERSNRNGSNVQPTMRAAWQPTDEHSLWAAWSRPVRASTRVERDRAFFNVPPALVTALGCREFINGTCLNGDPNAGLLRVNVVELGWRARLGRDWDADLALFRSHSEGTTNQGANLPLVQTHTQVQGGELVLRGRLSNTLTLQTQLALHDSAQSLDQGAKKPLPLLPRRSLMVQARWSPRADWDVELVGRHVGERQTSAAMVLPAYQHFDARIGWRSSPDWQWSFQASNLFDKRTAEYWESLKVNTAQGRAWVLGLQVRL